MDSTKFVQTQKTTLSGSGCTSTATSIVLSALKLPDGATNVTMTDFGDKGFITLEPGTSREEQISFTGITQNANGTATLTGVTRGIRFVAPYDEVSTNKFSHAGGAVAVVSNTAGFYNEMSSKDNDETITGTWTFTTLPVSTQVPVANTDVANKEYVDKTAFGGTITFDEEVVAGTAGETVAAGNLVYFDLTDNEWKLCDADTAATVEGVKLGIAQGSGTNGNAITGGVLVSGVDKNQSGMTQGDLIYASDTAGAIASSSGTTSKVIGIARSATDLYFDPNFYYVTNASETAKGFTEEATDAEVAAGTATGATGAKLFVTPAKLATYSPRNCGVTTFDLSTATGTQNIAHGIGKAPKAVRLTIRASSVTTLGSGGWISGSDTVYTNTTQSSNYFFINSDAGATGNSSLAGNTLTMLTTGALTGYQTGVVTVDATNIIITWTKTGSPGGTAYISWEATG